MNREQLKKNILELLVRRLQLSEIDIEEYNYDAALFFSANDDSILELDSVDSLEIIVGLKQEFGVVVGEEDMKHLYSVNTIADFILSSETSN